MAFRKIKVFWNLLVLHLLTLKLALLSKLSYWNV